MESCLFSYFSCFLCRLSFGVDFCPFPDGFSNDFAFDLFNTKATFLNTKNKDRFAERVIKNRLFFVSGGILGGTTEIQKNIIAQRGLGLPR